MSIHIELLLLVLGLMFYLTLFLALRILINKFSTIEELYVRNNTRLALILSMVKKYFKGNVASLKDIKEIQQTLIFDYSPESWQSEEVQKTEKKAVRQLKSFSAIRRREAATFLGLLRTEGGRIALEEALQQEKNASVKIYISNALTDIYSPESLPILISELIGSHKWYREKAISNILEYGQAFMPYFFQLRETNDIEHIELLIKFSGENLNEQLKAYLFDFVDRYESRVTELEQYYQEASDQGLRQYKKSYVQKDLEILLEKACRILSNTYYNDFSSPIYVESHLRVVRNNAFWAASKQKSTEALQMLLSNLWDAPYERTLIATISNMTEANPRFMYLIEDAFERETDPDISSRLAQILSNKIEYYILRLNTKGDTRAAAILKTLIASGKINELIGFINQNKDPDLDNRLVHLLRENVPVGSAVETAFQTYLNPQFLKKWGLERIVAKNERQRAEKDTQLILVVIAMTLVSIGAFPLYYYLTHTELLAIAPLYINLKQFVIEFNYLLAYYSLSINASYLLLLALSYANLLRQAKLWNLKNVTMLFRKRMLPSISIVAPAYNEEKTIIASAHSLLNLNYPDYELIIVNDGSSDETLLTLIKNFGLVRTDYLYTSSLPTEPIRGIYRNPSYPKLLVIDKSNGGKADSLNAGINVANKEYFCGIDADSLLESDALLKLSSLTLDESVETPALGGNIFPINGCKVDQGHISEIHIPKNHLARFQTIEYIRAFMAGRMGWQQINSLLIISGAFGLFRKDRIISIGGYLTNKGLYKKDTVGEDMELVVRISRLLHDTGQKFKILYAFNANCWTEVPEDFKSLRSQRYRWHRGLIDILYFHRQMMFRPKYGTTGTLGLPYFLVFEAIGPMIEFQGYLMVVLAAALGILDERLALLLFFTTIFLGIIVSLSSLLIAERENNYFKIKDISVLILYAVVENFGPRQMFSFWRIIGQFKIIIGQQGWGHMKRKGL